MSLDPLAQLHVVTIGAIALIFCGTLWILRRVCLLPLIEVMERRHARVEGARAGRAEADRALLAAREAEEATLAAAREQAGRRAAAMEEELARLRTERLARAAAEADAVLARGREEAAALRHAEAGRLRDELRSCADQTLTRMIGPVNGDAVMLIVSRVLAAQESG